MLSEIEDLEVIHPTGFKWTAWTKPVNMVDSNFVDPFNKAEIIKKEVDPIDQIINEH